MKRNDYNAYTKQLEENLQSLHDLLPNKHGPALATTSAQAVEQLIGVLFPQVINSGIKEHILKLQETYDEQSLELALQLAKDIFEEQFFKEPSLQLRIEIALRCAFAYLTMAVVSAPLEGLDTITIDKHLTIGFAGPIRGAGGTAGALCVIVADYLRQLAKLPQHKEKEIQTITQEVLNYHSDITRLQYEPTKEELETLLTHLPLQITGPITGHTKASKEDTIRGGMCLVLAECLLSKSPKLLLRIKSAIKKGFPLENWLFLEKLSKLQKKRKTTSTITTPIYLKDSIAGRPILGYPNTQGGFRLRLGRTRATGLAAVAVHPCAMIITHNTLAIGSQLRTELPGKAAIITPCDTITPPLVQLKNGNLLYIKTIKDAKKHLKNITKILSLGDMLISPAEFSINNAKVPELGLTPEEWKFKVLNLLD